MRTDDEADYREGVVLDRPTKQGQGSLVNCGMRKVRVCCWRLSRPDLETVITGHILDFIMVNCIVSVHEK